MRFSGISQVLLFELGLIIQFLLLEESMGVPAHPSHCHA